MKKINSINEMINKLEEVISYYKSICTNPYEDKINFRIMKYESILENIKEYNNATQDQIIWINGLHKTVEKKIKKYQLITK